MTYNNNAKTITVYDKPQLTVLSLSANKVVEQPLQAGTGGPGHRCGQGDVPFRLFAV